MKSFIVLILTMLIAATGFSAVVTNAMYGGTYANWATSWTAISSLNDPNDSINPGRLDFVGDATNPGAYMATDSNYLYFRVRVKATGTTVDAWQDSIWLMVDKVGQGTTNVPDYAFAWDTKGRFLSDQSQEHGLELQTNSSRGSYWNTVLMDDIDGNVAKKIAPPDFNTNGNGYVRTIDDQTTSAFGQTTFIDFALSWNYLAAQTTLSTGQTWRIQLASRADSTDHVAPTADIAGGASPSSSIENWSAPISIPEPASIMMIGLGGGLLMLIRRFYRR